MKTGLNHRIVIVGCGNVAWQIAKHLTSLKGYKVSVYNHKKNRLLEEFKTRLKCTIHEGFDPFEPDADMYLLCVSDKAIASVARKINISNPRAILLHTSGTVKLSELGNRIHGTAVFYPLQSFSRKDELNWKEIPIIIETNSKETLRELCFFANQFSHKIRVSTFKDRLRLHLAAVVVNNFTNALYAEAKWFLGKGSKTLNFDLLLPLIEKTTGKLKTMTPLEAQTGPAKRKDQLVINKHLDLLSQNKELKKLYKQLSKLIVTQQHRKI